MRSRHKAAHRFYEAVMNLKCKMRCKLHRHRPQIEQVSETRFFAVRIGCGNIGTAGSQTLEPMRPNLRTTNQRSNQCFQIWNHRFPHRCEQQPQPLRHRTVSSSLTAGLHSTLHSTFARPRHKVRHRRPDLWEVRTPIASSYLGNPEHL